MTVATLGDVITPDPPGYVGLLMPTSRAHAQIKSFALTRAADDINIISNIIYYFFLFQNIKQFQTMKMMLSNCLCVSLQDSTI